MDWTGGGMISDQEMTETQRKALEDVARYFEGLLLKNRKGSGLKAAAVHLARTAGYEQVGSQIKPTFKHAAHILKEVENDLAAWEAMALMVKHFAKNGLPLTNDMTFFITRILEGKLIKPNSKSSAWANLDRDLPLAMGVYMLTEKSMGITKAIASVADIAAQEGIHLSPEAIRKIWKRHQEHVTKSAKEGPHYYIENQASPLKR